MSEVNTLNPVKYFRNFKDFYEGRRRLGNGQSQGMFRIDTMQYATPGKIEKKMNEAVRYAYPKVESSAG